jgi:hypothetical protein
MQNSYKALLQAILFFGLCFITSAHTGDDQTKLDHSNGINYVINTKQDVLLAVLVTDEAQKPVRNAIVKLLEENGKELKSQLTDETGIVSFLCKSGSAYRVRVEHAEYRNTEEPVSIEQNRTESFFISIAMKKRMGQDKNARSLMVTVIDDQSGKAIENALVVAEGQQYRTDVSGKAYFNNIVAIGEKGTVHASASGYVTETQSYIAAGEQLKNGYAPIDELTFKLKKAVSQKIKFIVQVLDYSTGNRMEKADVKVLTASGKTVLEKPTSIRGEAAADVLRSDLDNAPFKVKASKKDYEKSESDITSDFLHLGNDPVFFTVYLKAKKVKDEKQYGAFYVPSGEWVPTGITFKKGDYFRIEATGYFTAKDGQHIGPEGGGFWMWWTLAGEIGTQRISLGRSGGGEVTQGGALKLGTPRGLGSKEFVKEDVENLQGKLTVYVYSKGGVAEKIEGFTKYDVAADVNRLMVIRNDVVAKRFDSWEAMQQDLKRIIDKYNLSQVKANVDEFPYGCYELLVRAITLPNSKYVKVCVECMDQLIKAVQAKMPK